MNNTSPLRDITRELLGRIGQASLVVGVPSFNNGSTIGHVVRMAAEGLTKFFPSHSFAIVVADGGSTLDNSREEALAGIRESRIPGVVGIYRGLPGKGSAVRMIFAAAAELQAQAVALLDADLRSIEPFWVERLLGPILQAGAAFVSPLYVRYKYDGTITNNVAYNMLRCLYGKRIRQPIGGEFGLAMPLVRSLLAQPVWDTDIARFGIDIWLTVSALTAQVPCYQTHLGVKVHDAKDPATSLEPMFRQVVGTLFSLMEVTEEHWLPRDGSEPVPVWGDPIHQEPEAFPIDLDRLITQFYLSWKTLHGAWESVLQPDTFSELAAYVASGSRVFELPTDLWVRILFEFAAAFHRRPDYKRQILELLSPLYFARVASFIRRTQALSNQEAEKVVEEQARIFEVRKPYLRSLWSAGDHK